MKRIRHFLNTIQTSWSEDPAARGAAKMTAGAILVGEGLFGVARRVVSGGGRTRVPFCLEHALQFPSDHRPAG